MLSRMLEKEQRLPWNENFDHKFLNSLTAILYSNFLLKNRQKTNVYQQIRILTRLLQHVNN